MQNWMLTLLLIFTGAMLEAGAKKAPPGGGIRVDFITPLEIEADTGSGIRLSRRKRKDGKNYLYDVILTKNELTGKWTKFNVTVRTPKDTWAVFAIRGINGTQGHPVLHCDALKFSGTTVQNPDFEQLTRQGTLAVWGGTKDRVVQPAKDAASGKGYARVTYEHPISQRIRLKAGVPADFTLMVRRENDQKFVPPKGTHAAYDPLSGTVVHVSSGRMELVPTFENCSVYYTPTAREKGKRIAVTPFFREHGSKTWVQGLPLTDVRPEGVFRGSLLLLKENTAYEMKLEISGEVKDTVYGKFTTCNSKVPVKKTIVLDPASFPGKMSRFESGTPQGYIRYTMKPGVLKGGKEGDNGAVLELSKVKYVILDGLTVKANMVRRGIWVSECKNIIIRNCDVSDFGRTDNIRGLHMKGRWLYQGNETGWDGGIFVRYSKNVLVERCYVHDPRSTSNSWLYSHPTGPEAVFMDRNQGGIVLRYCDLVGSDKKRWNDAVESSGNGDLDGGIGRDADIYGNLFAFSNDDSIEIEGQEMNIRVYRNRFEGSYCGVSTGCNRMGPSYQFSNLYYRLGDENGRFGLPFKNGMSNQGAGTIYVFNNTVFSPGVHTATGAFHNKKPQFELPVKAWFRNNIIHATNAAFDRADFRRWKCSLDYDLIYGLSPREEGAEKKFFAQIGQEQHVLFADPKFRSIGKADFRLAPESPARNSAEPVPGMDMKNKGAFQPGSFALLPYRPLDVTLSANELRFKDEFDTAPRTVTVTAGKNFPGGSFTVKLNDDFFAVKPLSGTLKPGKTLTFTITVDPAKMPMPKMYRGMVLFRFADGLSRPLSVYADYRDSEKRLKESEKHGVIIPGPCVTNQDFVSSVKVPADGIYFLVGEGAIQTHAEVFVQIGEAKTTRAARFIGRNAPELKHTFGLVRNGHLSAWYFPLKAGVQTFRFRSKLRNMNVKRFFLTQEPEWFIR